MSLTVTVNVQDSGPALLFDLHVTVVVPTGKNEPEAGEQTTVPQVPVVVGALYVTTAPHWFGSLLCVLFAGQVIVQGAVPVTVTVKVQEAVLLDASVAVQVTVVVPTGKQVPDAGTQEAVAPRQLSVGVGVV